MNIFDHNFSRCQRFILLKKGGRGTIRSLLYRACFKNGISQIFTYFNMVMRNTEAQTTKFVAWSSDQGLTTMRYVNPKSTSRIVKMKHLTVCVWNKPCSFCAENKTVACIKDGVGVGKDRLYHSSCAHGAGNRVAETIWVLAFPIWQVTVFVNSKSF